jgi:iron(III) transport system permease protein
MNVMATLAAQSLLCALVLLALGVPLLVLCRWLWLGASRTG